MDVTVQPRDAANHAFERILRSLDDPLSLPMVTLDYFAEIHDEMDSMHITLEPIARKKFVKSAARQLAHLKEKTEEEPSRINVDGDWIGKSGHGNQVLTEIEEALLCGILSSQRHLGVKIVRSTICEIARSTYPNKGAVFSKEWLEGFLHRNEDLFVLRTKKSMKECRSNEVTFDQTLLFCNVFEEMLSEYASKGIPLHPETLCNMDETLLQIVSNGKVDIELVPCRELTGTDSIRDPSVVGSMLVFVNAAGTVPYVYFCMKKEGKAKKHRVPNLVLQQNTRQSNATTVLKCADSWSKTGYISAKHVKEAIAGFAGVMKERWGHTKHPIILLANNLRQHQTQETLELSAENQIVLQMLTLNASHFLQPLDDKLFVVFKSQLLLRYQ